MKLILARHAEADSAHSDAERRLTPRGRSDAQRVGTVLQGSGWQFEEILASPLVRTMETASIFHQQIGDSPEPQAASFLAPGLDAAAALDHLNDSGIRGAALWVCHMPDIASFAAALLGISPSGLYVTPGTTLALNLSFPLQPGKAMLVWAMQPEYLAALAR
jgi:phosphohistidine phosphatase